MGLIFPLLMVANAEQRACPYNEEVTMDDFNASVSCRFPNVNKTADHWITWTDKNIRKGAVTNNTYTQDEIVCQGTLPSWMVPDQYPSSPSKSFHFRNKTINATAFESTAPFQWQWSFDAMLSDKEVGDFEVVFDPFMMQNVSWDIRGPSAANKTLRNVAVSATVAGWKRGLTAVTLRTSESDAFTLALKVNQTTCYGTVRFFIFDIKAYTYATYMISLSVIAQAIVFVFTSALGDHKSYRKKLMVYSSLFGGTSAVFMALVSDDFGLVGDAHKYKVTGVLLVVGNVAFGLSNVMYNAFLSFLALAHPQMKEATAGGKPDAEKLLATYIRVEERISNTGFAYGYFGGSVCLVFTLAIVIIWPNNFGLCLSCILTGVWWIVFTIPCMLHMDARPGPPLPKKYQGWFGWMRYGLADTWEVLVNIKTMPHTYRFIICYWMFSDTYGTIAAVAILFARDEFEMSTMMLAILSVIVPMFAGLGNLVEMAINHSLKKTQKQWVIINLAILAALCAYAMLGAIPGMPIGLVNSWELFVIGSVFGFVMGPMQAFARVVLADLTPPGLESEFFGAWELTDKGSSWIGPVVVGICYEVFGNIRYSFIYLFTFCVVPLLILHYKVDVDQGRKDTRSLKTMVWVKKRRQHKRKEKKRARGQKVTSSANSSSAATTNLFSKRGTKVAPSAASSVADSSQNSSDSSDDENETEIQSSAVSGTGSTVESVVESEAVAEV